MKSYHLLNEAKELLWLANSVLDQVLAEPDPESGRVNIVILYRAKESHQRRSLVYPLYLMPPE
jgi:hypothetical protein